MPAGTLGLLMLVLAPAASIRAGEASIHARLDELVEMRADGPLSPIADDAAFLRRIYLDLAGRIPTLEETREFLQDASPAKREAVIDRLLASDDYPRRMRDLFTVMLMERRGENEEWSAFLESSFAANRPWDRIAADILAPDAENEQTRGAAFFYTSRLDHYGQQPDDMPGLVRDIGRMFLGVDVQCAQCHDHLFIDDYKQEHYQGLFAFVSTAFIRRDVEFPAVGEQPLAAKIGFTSVFAQVPRETGPRLPGGEEIEVPTFAKGEEYEIPPDKKAKTPGVPKFSPMRRLADALPRADNSVFVENAVNRLWWVMMGRGLVHPLDLRHPDNPPTHPDVLSLLVEEFASHGLDIKWLLRELALSRTYQRGSRLPEGASPPRAETYRAGLERPLSAEQMLQSVLIATGHAPNRGAALEDDFLKDLTARFQKALANPPKEPEGEFTPSVKAALFLSNDEAVLKLFERRPSNLIDRLNELNSSAEIADELYLTVLTRPPTADELSEVETYLAANTHRRETAFGHLAWALVTSTEFCLNH